MRANTHATEARDDYRSRPYYGGTDPGYMSGGFARTRDADPLEISNHEVALERYRAAGAEPRVDQFNHWAVGWVDHITLPITAKAVAVLAELAEAIESYPVLDDEHYSDTEWAEAHPSDGRCYSTSLEDYGEPCPCGRERS